MVYLLEADGHTILFQYLNVGSTVFYNEISKQCAGFSTKFPISNLSSWVCYQTASVVEHVCYSYYSYASTVDIHLN